MAGGGGPVTRIESPASAVAVSAADQLVVGASTQRAGLTVWDLAGDVVADVAIPAVHGTVYAATFDPGGEHLVTTDGSSGDVLVWSVADLRAHRIAPVRLVGGDRQLVSLDLFGDRVVTIDASRAVRQLSLTDARPVGRPDDGAGPPRPLAGPDPGRRLPAGRGAGRRRPRRRGRRVGRPRPVPVHRGRFQVDGLVAIAGDPTGDELSGVTADGSIVTIDGAGRSGRRCPPPWGRWPRPLRRPPRARRRRARVGDHRHGHGRQPRPEERPRGRHARRLEHRRRRADRGGDEGRRGPRPLDVGPVDRGRPVRRRPRPGDRPGAVAGRHHRRVGPPRPDDEGASSSTRRPAAPGS